MLHHPERFDQSKSRYSMDWFYPILTGVYQGQRAQDHIHQHWDTFVKYGMGCLCVSDEPWVTIAESCELTMALIAAGKRDSATELFSWLHQYRCDDGVHWTGYQYH
ncbi:MAG: prenyltransferase, partial [Proteobacteria bacterium]|nr:prenyltransferase [Pseudomonadota bacterium]